MNHVYISIGSNLGNPTYQVRRAVDALRGVGQVTAVSSIYETEPWGTEKDQPHFVNAVAALETILEPMDLLLALKAAEEQIGREPSERRWGPRVIDFDILVFGDRAVNTPQLTIPHAHMKERAFVLVPLAEIDHTFEPLRDALPASELASVRKL